MAEKEEVAQEWEKQAEKEEVVGEVMCIRIQLLIPVW